MNPQQWKSGGMWGLALVAVLATALAGCKKPETTGGSSTNPAGGRRQIVIGMVAKAESNDVFQAARTGAQDEANQLGEQYNVDIQIAWRTPADENAAEQADAIETLANQKVDGIMVSCSDAATLTAAINDAEDKGVPVVCFDSDAPDSKRLCIYGTDDVALGHMLMADLAGFMGDKGTIAILAGNESAPNLRKRVEGVREELKNHPNMHELDEGKGVFYHEEIPAKAVDAINNAMNANPGKINGWVFVGGWPLFTENALNWPPGTIKVVSCDALPNELDYVRKGYVQELINQDCYGWGTKSVDILVNKILFNKDPDPADMDPGTRHIRDKYLTQVTKENVDQFATSWDKWLKPH